MFDNETKKQPIIYQCRSCNRNLASNNPASQYQRQKLIQRTVRMPSSQYSMNLAGLTVFSKALVTGQIVEQAGTPYYVPPNINWNQMSDRPVPSVQRVKTASYGASSTKSTIVRNRPGAMSPGGIGVDIKHNSYDRYLNRLKGKGPLKRGVTIIPQVVPFNQAYPIYGGKMYKTGVIDSCACEPDDLEKVYNNPANAIQDEIFSVKYEFNVGDYVWARKDPDVNILFKAVILSIDENVYEIQFEDETIIYTTIEESDIRIYFDCSCSNCNESISDIYLRSFNTNELTSVICRLINV